MKNIFYPIGDKFTFALFTIQNTLQNYYNNNATDVLARKHHIHRCIFPNCHRIEISFHRIRRILHILQTVLSKLSVFLSLLTNHKNVGYRCRRVIIKNTNFTNQLYCRCLWDYAKCSLNPANKIDARLFSFLYKLVALKSEDILEIWLFNRCQVTAGGASLYTIALHTFDVKFLDFKVFNF